MRPSIVTIVLIAVLAGGIWGPGPSASPGLGKGSPAAASESFAGQPGKHSQAPVAGEEELGPVYMYGELMEKPYVFTNVGGDTLYLNGVPYWPIREPLRPWQRALQQLPESEKQRRLEKARRVCAFDDSVWGVVSAMHDSGATYEECLDAFAAMYDNSRFVVAGSVEKIGNGIYLQWADGIDGTIGLSFEPSPPLPTKEEIHKGQMEDFWRNVRSGRMVARGFSQGQTYSFTAPGPDLERMNRLIERLAAGDTLSEESMIGTPFMYQPRFRMDVARRAVQRKAREE